MYVDPLLLVALLVLLVGTSVLAVVAYVRYRRCEDVYQAYGRVRSVPAPAPPSVAPAPDPATDRYVSGADYGEPPAAFAPPDAASTAAEPEARSAAPEPELPLAPPVVSVPPVPAETPLEPTSPVAAESDTFFYEYTAHGFVPVDPYEPEPMPTPDAAPASTEPPGTYGSAGDGHCDDAPQQDDAEPGLEATTITPAVSEDGFVWL